MIVGFAIIAQGFLATAWTISQLFDIIIFNLILGIPFVVVGALLLRIYDIDKKEEKFDEANPPLDEEDEEK